MKKSLLLFLGVAFAALFLSGCGRNDSGKNNFLEQVGVLSPGEWEEVTHANFWGNPAFFASADYSFPNIKFSHPSNWDFTCCEDKDYGSAHMIFSSADHDIELPYVKITNYSLIGCPADDTKCSIDEIVKKTPEEKFNEVVSLVPSSVKVKSEKTLKGLKSKAFNYETIDGNGAKIDSYVFKTEQGVIEVSFVHFDGLKAGFVDDFLGRIGKDGV